MTTSFLELDLAALRESPLNPRRHYDTDKLQFLADNLASVGVLQPLIVRPDVVKAGAGQTYEIGAGHRRFRAATLAKISRVPCLVRDMTDHQFIELLNIENLQREDVHPLDEAKGYELLMGKPYKMPVETIAAKVGKSIKYVYDRIKLLALCKEARGFFWEGQIEAGHAILLARLSATEQATVIGTPAKDYDDGGLFRVEQRLYPEDDARESTGKRHHRTPVTVQSVRELDDWIKRHIRFKVTQADAFLFPETVAQAEQAVAAQRKIIEITHEYLASDAVRQAGEAKVYGEQAWRRADGQDGSKPCDRSVLGVIASGAGRGQAFEVCVNKDRCLVHWGAEIRAREKRAKAADQGATGGKAETPDTHERARQREAAERARDEAARAQWDLAKPALWAAMANRVKAMPVWATGQLVGLLLERLPQPICKAAQQYLPCGSKPDDILRFLAFVKLYQEIDSTYWAVRDFPKRAKQFKVDVKKILAELATPVAQTPTPDSPAKGKKKSTRKKAA